MKEVYFVSDVHVQSFFREKCHLFAWKVFSQMAALSWRFLWSLLGRIFHLHWKACGCKMIWSLVHTNLDVYKCQFESSLGWFFPSHRTSDQIPILIENLSSVILNNVALKANECIHNRLSSQGQNFVSVVRKRSIVWMSKIWILPPILCRVTTMLTKQYIYVWLFELIGILVIWRESYQQSLNVPRLQLIHQIDLGVILPP